MDFRLLFDIFGIIALAAGGVLYLRSTSARLNAEESAKLAATRGDRIADLEAKVGRQSERITRLEGQMEAIQSIKAQEIALEVVRLVHQEFAVRERRRADDAWDEPHGENPPI